MVAQLVQRRDVSVERGVGAVGGQPDSLAVRRVEAAGKVLFLPGIDWGPLAPLTRGGGKKGEGY